MTDESPEQIAAAREDGESTPVDPVTGVRVVSPPPTLTNGVPIHQRPPLRAGDHATIAGELVAHELAGCIVDEEKIWRYAAPVWTELPDREAQKVLLAYSGRPYQHGKGTKDLVIDRSDVTGSLACAKDLLAFPGFFDGVRAGVGFKNGFLAIVGGRATLLEPDPQHRIRAAHPFDWNPRAPHAELDAFFDTIFALDSEDEGAAKRALIQEFFGAAMFGLAPSFQKCLLFFGKAGNGKSEILKILASVFPDQSVLAALPPQMWGEQFSVEALAGKLANIVDEIPQKDIVSGNTFKAVITGNQVAAERKYQPKFTFRPRAAHIFAGNEMPATIDLTEAFFDRFIVVHFLRKIRGTPAAVRDIADRIIAACRPGIVAWAAEGAERLLAQNEYTVPSSSAAMAEQWRRNCDNVAIFFDQCTVPARDFDPIGPGNGTKAHKLYAEYRDWCEKNGFKRGSSKTFADRADALDVTPLKHDDANYYPVNLLIRE